MSLWGVLSSPVSWRVGVAVDVDDEKNPKMMWRDFF